MSPLALTEQHSVSNTGYRFRAWPLSGDEGGGWLVEYPDLPSCMSDGETIDEAIANPEDANRCWIVAMEKADWPISPLSTVNREAVGKRREAANE